MPPIVAAVAIAAKAFIVTVGSAFLALGFSAGTAGFIAGTILKIGIGLAIGYVMRALSPKPDAGAVDQGQEIALKFDPTYPREVVVGKSATGGSLVYATVSGSNNEFLWRVIALSDCEIEEVTEVWGNGELLTFSGDLHTGYRLCTSHFRNASSVSKLSLRIYKGTDAQTADADLDAASSEWSSTCRGRGIAYAIAKFEYDAEAFQGGEPSLMFVVKGAKIPDPRTGTTVWTANAALIAAKAMAGFEMNGVRVVGLGAADEDVPSAQVEDAADACDEAIALAAGGTEARYTANGLLSGAESAREIITNLTAAMAGRHIDRGGEVVFLPGVARTAVMRITDADILSDEPIVYAQKRTADQLINTVVSTFVDPSSAWQEGPLPVRKDAAAITEDGDRFVSRRGYRFVTSKTQGQRLDEIALREGRKQARASVALPIWGIELEPGDWIEWQSARFTGVKTFVVEGLQMAISSDPSNPTARVQLALAEIDANVFAWTTSNEAGVTAGAVARPVPALSVSGWAVSVGTLTGGGASLPELRFAWTAATDPSIERIEIEYRVFGTTNVYATSARADAGALSITNGILPGTRMEGRARFVAGNRVGAWSIWDDETTGAEFVAGATSGSGNYAFAAVDMADQSTSGTTPLVVARLAFTGIDAAGTWQPVAYAGDFSGTAATITPGILWAGVWEIIETSTGGTSGTVLATDSFSASGSAAPLSISLANGASLAEIGVDVGGARDLILVIYRTSTLNNLLNCDFHFEATYRGP
ncbi:MAG: phage tail protein [Beijerinckiaceae bacterium]